MKTSSSIKLAAYQIALILLSSIITSSCTNPTPQPTGNTNESAQAVNEKNLNTNNEQDAQFLVHMAEVNLQEIQLGQLAQQNSKVTAVKELGKMMVEAHTKSQEEVTALAKTKMMTIPTSISDTAEDAYNKIKSLTGKDFDKEYCSKMVNGHKETIALVEKESTDAVDADIKKWAAATLPELRTHLEHAVSCEQKVSSAK